MQDVYKELMKPIGNIQKNVNPSYIIHSGLKTT